MADETRSTGDHSRPADRSTRAQDRSEADRNSQAAADFRRLNQAQRIADKRLNLAARNLAAISAAIDHKYGQHSREARTMKAAAHEALARSLEQGRTMTAPKLRPRDPVREEEQSQRTMANASMDRER